MANGETSDGNSSTGTTSDSFTELLVDTIETSVRTSVKMMKLPLVMYAELLNSWAAAVDSIVDDFGTKPPKPPGARVVIDEVDDMVNRR